VRFLHTADWHVGRSIRGRSRTEESAAVLDQVVTIARDQDVDAVLVSGDIYDGPMPTPDAEAVTFDALLRLRDARIAVVAIAGNHDSPARLAAWAGVLRAIGSTVTPRITRDPADLVVEVPARDGTHAAAIACVPFVPERWFLRGETLFDSAEGTYQTYADGMGAVLEGAAAAAFRPDRVNVLMAHLYADGASFGGGEREATIGMDYAVPPARLPAQATYVALGHVHRPQAVKGSPAPARYAGSLLQLDFGETGHAKSVSVVEAAPGAPARIAEIPLTAGKRLVDVRGTIDEVLAAAASLGDSWVRVFVTTDGPRPGVAEVVRDALPGAVAVHLEYERAEVDVPTEPVGSLGPRDQFLRFFRSHHGADPDTALIQAFDEVLAAELAGTGDG
jgi:exonuclease SbcD